MTEDVDAWLTDRATVMSRPTLRTVANLLRAVMRYAVQNKRIKVAPIIRVSGRAARPDSRVYAPSVEEVLRPEEAMPTPMTKATVRVQAGTGLRSSELLGLRVVDCSIDFATVKVTGQLSRAGERAALKTDSSERTVPMSVEVADALAPLLEYAEPEALVFTPARADRSWHSSYGALFKKAVAKAELPEQMSSHDLRHHYATTLLRAGLSPVAVGRLMGHTNGTLALKTYVHWMPDDDALARRALDAAWGRKSTPPSGRLSAVR